MDTESLLRAALDTRNVRTVHELVFVAPWELRDWLLLPEDKAQHVLEQVYSNLAAPLLPAHSLQLPILQLPLLGSLSGPGLVELAGPSGSGKTQFCLHAAALAATQGDVFWLDTERAFSAARSLEILQELAPESALAALARIRVSHCASLAELDASLHGLSSPLVIIDSVAAAARSDENVPRRQAALCSLAARLKRFGRVLVTNHAGEHAGSFETKQVALGNAWHHAVNWRLLLQDSTLRVEKSPGGAPRMLSFAIHAGGFVEV